MRQQSFRRNCRILPLLLGLSSIGLGQVPIIFDTDMGNDIDDALALAVLHSLTSRGECRLIGVTLTNASASAIPYVQMINKFYGRAGLPVGSALRHVIDGDHDDYLRAALSSAPAPYLPSGSPTRTESAVVLLRRLLAASTDKVTVVQVGFSTNMAMLLDSPPDNISPMTGMELVKSKVALLSAMAGNFADLKPEYNVKLDVASARTVFERWPTPVIFSGFEIGRDLVYPSQSIERDFAYTDWHPVAVSYRAYSKMPYDRPTWDLTAALVAVRSDHHYFGLSAKGTIHVEENGTTRFEAGGGDRQYLLLDQSQRSRVLEALTLLASEPPHQVPASR
jgi:inosine-uridine nucleoside N-ribohydrolase